MDRFGSSTYFYQEVCHWPLLHRKIRFSQNTKWSSFNILLYHNYLALSTALGDPYGLWRSIYLSRNLTKCSRFAGGIREKVEHLKLSSHSKTPTLNQFIRQKFPKKMNRFIRYKNPVLKMNFSLDDVDLKQDKQRVLHCFNGWHCHVVGHKVRKEI